MKTLLLPAALLLAFACPRDALAHAGETGPDAARAPRLVYPEREASSAKGLGTLAAAWSAVAQHAPSFDGGNGSTYSLRAGGTDVVRGDGPVRVLRFDQVLGGIPVFGARLVATVRSDGRVATLAGETSRVDPATLDLTPTLAPADAMSAARDLVAKHAGVDTATLTATVQGLRIHDPALVGFGGGVARASLAWQVSVRASDAAVRQRVLIDAHHGHALLGYSTAHTVGGASHGAGPGTGEKLLGMPLLATFTAGNDTIAPGTFLCDESSNDCTGGADPDADRAHAFARGVYDLYAGLHLRDSIDGQGMTLASTVHYASGFCNAFWDVDWQQMFYGDGCDIVVDDVVGHELTHGVTDHTSGLIYAYESGAINESLSDVWGEYYDLSNASADDTPGTRWIVAEEVDGGLRNMRDPGALFDPDRMLSPLFWINPVDGGGVHFNSGVNNKAAYLLADGDTFNGQTVAGLGLEKPLHLYYYLQTILLTPTSNYADLGHYLAEGCKDLIGAHGITASDCDQVEKTVVATEMRERSPLLPDSAPVCTAGDVANDVVFDDFEDATASKARWTSKLVLGEDAWTIASLQVPIAGQRSLRADDLPFASDSVVELDDPVVVPAGGFLHFDHAYVWEYGGYDGGVPQYSTDDGVTWTPFPSELIEGENYPGLIQPGASLGGGEGFAGDSLGVGSTRVDLSTFAGQSLRLRFFASSDASFDAGTPDGWWIDNVRVSNCVAAQPGIFSDGFE